MLQFLSDIFHFFGDRIQDAIPANGFRSFSADKVSHGLTLPESSTESFTKTTPFLNNEGSNNICEFAVNVNELSHKL